MVSSLVATEVGSRLGVVEDVERRRRQDMQNYFLRVCVALPISKPLRRGGFITDSDGVRTWVKFKYERLPIFCHFYGLLGHDLRHCASHYVVEKNGGDVEYQYGDRLKVSGGRQRSPPWKGAAKSSPDSWMLENPGVDFSQRDDHVKNQGIDPDNQQICTENKGIEDADKGNSIPIIVDKEVGNSNSKLLAITCSTR